MPQAPSLEQAFALAKDRGLARASAISEIEMVLSFDLTAEEMKTEINEVLTRLKAKLAKPAA